MIQTAPLPAPEHLSPTRAVANGLEQFPSRCDVCLTSHRAECAYRLTLSPSNLRSAVMLRSVGSAQPLPCRGEQRETGMGLFPFGTR